MVVRWSILALGAVVCLNLISTGDLCRAEEKLPRAIAELKPLFDYPVRDTSICVGGDGNYYLWDKEGRVRAKQ